MSEAVDKLRRPALNGSIHSNVLDKLKRPKLNTVLHLWSYRSYTES